ncbi:MAG: DUF2335 domain-containing protein [Clostridiales bacterium]|nr:DUF2335 domain-containing protein [Clostridiales bacterium]
MPSAEQLEKYEMICPGAAGKLITMAENQSLHRQELEKIVISSGARDSLLGIICAGTLGLVSIVGV